MRIFSFGGGIQSVAALALAAHRKIDFRIFVFANTGHDSENPATLDYVENVAKPYAEKYGMSIVEVAREKYGEQSTLYQDLARSESRSIGIPIWMPNGVPSPRRNCTREYKIQPIERWLRARGATPENPATVGIGITLDEYLRAKPGVTGVQRRVYPLMDLYLERKDCERLIREAGLPMPEKSACYFCPFQNDAQWQRHQKTPAVFEQAVKLERQLLERSERISGYPVYLTKYGVPLDEAVQKNPNDEDGQPDCDSGYCML